MAWPHCVLWLMFLAQRLVWPELCVAGEGLTLVLCKIRLGASHVDNWLPTALVSELFPWICATCKCQSQHSLRVACSLCVPGAGSSKEVKMFWRNFPTFIFSFSFPIPSSSVLTYLWISVGNFCHIWCYTHVNNSEAIRGFLRLRR